MADTITKSHFKLDARTNREATKIVFERVRDIGFIWDSFKMGTKTNDSIEASS